MPYHLEQPRYGESSEAFLSRKNIKLEARVTELENMARGIEAIDSSTYTNPALAIKFAQHLCTEALKH